MKPDPRIIYKIVDKMESDPEFAFDTEGNPDIERALRDEIHYREGRRSAQSAMDDEPPAPVPQEDAFTRFMNAGSAATKPDQPAGAAIRGAGQGIGLGWGDEALAAGKAVGNALIHPDQDTPGNFKQIYNDDVKESRDNWNTALEKQPLAANAGMLVGGLAAPVKGVGLAGAGKYANAAFKGAQIGGVMGAGMNENPEDIGRDVDHGMIAGGVLGAAGEAIGTGVGRAANWVSNKADDLLAAALDIPVGSDEYILYKQNGLFDKIMAIVRGNSNAPYTAGQTRMNIEAPYEGVEGSALYPKVDRMRQLPPTDSAPPAFGTQGKIGPVGQPQSIDFGPTTPTNSGVAGDFNDALANVHSGPPEWVSGRQAPGPGEFRGGMDDWMNMSSSDLAEILPPRNPVDVAPPRQIRAAPRPPPAPVAPPAPQMPEEAQIASQKLGGLIKKGGGGFLPSSGGLQPSTFTGGLAQAVMGRSEFVGGVGFSKIADKMANLLAASDAASGMSRMASGKMKQLIDAVLASPHPEVEDYMAQEMSPPYKALRMEAQNALEKETGN